MTYTFKLSRRLASLSGTAGALATLITLSCTIGENLTAPLPIDLTPASVSLPFGGSQQFTLGSSLDGPTVTWSASGGTISSTGLYTAGQTAGSYRVTATGPSGKADTSAVSITPLPPAPPPPSDSGVAVFPGQSIQAAVDANPAGTIFIIKAGTHRNQTVIPKTGNAFIGEPGTVMDGGLVTAHAFRLPSGATGSAIPSGVRIQALKITRYTPAYQAGAIMGGSTSAATNSNDWIIRGNEIAYNTLGAGIRTGNRMRILSNNIHHNGEIGIVGTGDSILIEGNELAYNNTGGYSAGNEAGGFKVVKSRGLVVRNNWSHHNQGPGMWTDYDNIDVLYEGNTVEDNLTSGIFHEVSQAAIIRNNIVRRNGFGGFTWMYGAGIQIAGSRNVEVYGNTVSENARGIVGLMQERGNSLIYGHLELANLYVHDNIITMTVEATTSSGHQNITGIGVDFNDLTYYTSRGNRFVNNHYVLGTAAKYFEWMNSRRTEAEWQAYGQDVTGTFTR